MPQQRIFERSPEGWFIAVVTILAIVCGLQLQTTLDAWGLARHEHSRQYCFIGFLVSVAALIGLYGGGTASSQKNWWILLAFALAIVFGIPGFMLM